MLAVYGYGRLVDDICDDDRPAGLDAALLGLDAAQAEDPLVVDDLQRGAGGVGAAHALS